MKKTLTFVTLLAASASQAAGVAVDTQASRATGMGSVGVASARDSSAIFYNPAGILGVNTLDVQLGDSLILVDLGFTPEGSGTEESQFTPSPPAHAYFAYKLHDKVAAGVGVFTPYGANSEWPEGFSGRFLAQRSKLQTFNLNPTVAFAPVDWVRLGAGVQLQYGMFGLTSFVNPLIPGALVELSGTSWGFGYNAGLQVDLPRGLVTVGAHYRGQVTHDFEGDADFRDVPPPAVALVPPDQEFALTWRMPATLGLGVAIHPLPRLTLAADANWFDWGSTRELTVELRTTPQFSQTLHKNWHTRWNFHLGGEYGVSDALAVRAGFIYDPTPTPENTLSPDLPDADRLNFALGAGYRLGALRADLAYQLVVLRDQRSTLEALPGTYNGMGHVMGLTLGYSQ
ncbi:OmpP1/FadL family transporter [Archangium sp.]|jgi:long-chain fatty acid transport protein|uniref:OmpP1/FadL family transporter n=1 Tax=Archangium sp. TaxID=1872627 RepID=UPI002EDBA04E